MNKLHFGDNLYVLRNHVKDETADLVYLDPPFNSSRTHNVLFPEANGAGSEAQAEAFHDTWSWGHSAAVAYEDALRIGGDAAILLRALRSWLGDNGLMAYLAMMAVRLAELRRVMKPTGSLYLHCDPTASHYIKLILDAIFGQGGFQNEIIWKRTGAHSSSKRWGPVHDSILFYSASDKYRWNPVFQPYEPGYIERKYVRSDSSGRFQDVSLTGPGTRTGTSGMPWRNFDPTAKGRHWAVPGWAGESIPGFAEMTAQQKLDALDAADRIYWPQKAGAPSFPRIKQYPGKGNHIQDVITDIAAINSQAQERLHYPTQKPITLLERIIRASSAEGDTVIDPFCGCGTTIEAAEQLGRQWIGIDITHYAVTLIETRLLKGHPDASYKVFGRPSDLSGAQDLARRDKYQFQWWAAWLLGAQTYESKKGADRGIDANIFFANGPYGHGRIIISVKGGENVSPTMVRELNGVIQREGAEMGILITLAEPTRAMVADAAGAGFVEKSAHGRLPRVQIATVADLLDRRLPKLPPLPNFEDGSRPRSRKRDRDQFELILPFSGGGGLVTEDGVVIDPRFLQIARA